MKRRNILTNMAVSGIALAAANTAAVGDDIRMVTGNGNYFGEGLRDNGYHTGCYGKWHLYGGNRNRPIPPRARIATASIMSF